MNTTSPLSLTTQGTRSSLRVTDAIASWWVLPQVVHSNGHTFISGVTATGDVFAAQLRPGQEPIKTILDTIEVDDHNAAALSIPPAPHLPVAIWARHNLDQHLRFRVGNAPGSVRHFGPRRDLVFPSNVTYAQTHYDPSDPTNRWVLCRVGSRYWYLTKFTVDLAGDIAFQAPIAIIDSGTAANLFYTTTASTLLPNGNFGLRVALTGHPDPAYSPTQDIYAGLIDLTTGALLEADGETTIGNLDGTNLPTAPSDWPVAFSPNAGESTRLFLVSNAPNTFEVACASWVQSPLGEPTYHVAEASFGARRILLPDASNAYVTTDYNAALNQPHIRFEIDLNTSDLTPATGDKDLARRFVSTGDNRAWIFRVKSTGELVLTIGRADTNGASSQATTATAALPDLDGQDVSLAFECENDGAGAGFTLVKFYYRIGAGSWTQLGTDRTIAYNVYQSSTAPLEIPNSAASTRLTGSLYAARLYDASTSTLLASLDAETMFSDGDTTDATAVDTAGRTWTLKAGAEADTPINAWTSYDLGLAGEPVGHNPAAKYVGGLAFPDRTGGVVYVVRENAGTWTLERWVDEALDDTLVTATNGDKLFRAFPPSGGGPVEVAYSRMTSYVAFTDYESDILTVT